MNDRQETPHVPFRQACDLILGLPTRTAEQLIAQGVLPPPYKLGRRRYWRRADLIEALDRRAAAARSAAA